jgi:hypothetical protein
MSGYKGGVELLVGDQMRRGGAEWYRKKGMKGMDIRTSS